MSGPLNQLGKRCTAEIWHYNVTQVERTTCVTFVHVGEHGQWWLYIDGIPLAKVDLTPEGKNWLTEWAEPSKVPA